LPQRRQVRWEPSLCTLTSLVSRILTVKTFPALSTERRQRRGRRQADEADTVGGTFANASHQKYYVDSPGGCSAAQVGGWLVIDIGR